MRLTIAISGRFWPDRPELRFSELSPTGGGIVTRPSQPRSRLLCPRRRRRRTIRMTPTIALITLALHAPGEPPASDATSEPVTQEVRFGYKKGFFVEAD